MKAVAVSLLLVSMLLLMGGCSVNFVPVEPTDPPENGQTIIHEGESVLLIREMMQLDYRAMTVSEFNATIQELCADAGTNILR